MEFRRDEESLINDINFYKILKVKNDASSEEIEAAFRKLSKRYHPDRGGDKEVYSLIQEAYQTLSNETDRRVYDGMRKQVHSTGDWYDFKHQSKKHYDAMEYRQASSDDKLNFKKKNQELDQKRGIRRELEESLDIEDAKKKYETLLSERTAIDNAKPERLFSHGRFDGDAFNKLWDEKHGQPGDRDIVPRRGAPMAFNDPGGSNYASLDADEFGDPFVDDDEGNSIYGSRQFGTNVEVKASDLEGIGKTDYYKGHSRKDKEYKKKLKDRLRERQDATSDIGKMGFDDYKRDDFGGYGIHDKLGFDFSDRLTIDNAHSTGTGVSDIQARYDRMMQDRNRLN
jgi:curved DNA-binding protein CbpA